MERDGKSTYRSNEITDDISCRDRCGIRCHYLSLENVVGMKTGLTGKEGEVEESVPIKDGD